MNFDYLREIRTVELKKVMEYIPPGSVILEIGSGAGWQARELASHGFTVEGIDVIGNEVNYDYRDERVWNVKVYDGHNIPFPDQHFDVIFSSNVLEHIPHVKQFQGEIRRVLKDNGLCIHILPGSGWRFWTSVAFYAVRIRNLFMPSKGSSASKSEGGVTHQAFSIGRLFPPLHGERGNALSELYLFSIRAWESLFKKTNWEILAVKKNNLFYTGELFFGKKLSLEARERWSYILGSSCNIFLLRKSSRNTP